MRDRNLTLVAASAAIVCCGGTTLVAGLLGGGAVVAVWQFAALAAVAVVGLGLALLVARMLPCRPDDGARIALFKTASSSTLDQGMPR